MLETHPFGSFVPSQARYLILGSFPGKNSNLYFEWFYGSNRNQFWHIMEIVYNIKLNNKTDKINLLSAQRIALADVFFQVERKNNSNLDSNLTNPIINIKAISDILKRNEIRKIFFTSRFVENIYRKNFKKLIIKYPTITLVTLPSPSPRYARLTLLQKSKIYNKALPKLN
jgi:hypoxanthine-DNA glycosylase